MGRCIHSVIQLERYCTGTRAERLSLRLWAAGEELPVTDLGYTSSIRGSKFKFTRLLDQSAKAHVSQRRDQSSSSCGCVGIALQSFQDRSIAIIRYFRWRHVRYCLTDCTFGNSKRQETWRTIPFDRGSGIDRIDTTVQMHMQHAYAPKAKLLRCSSDTQQQTPCITRPTKWSFCDSPRKWLVCCDSFGCCNFQRGCYCTVSSTV
jgi:hypothetical protein